MNYFPFHIGDYAAHTAHLEPMEDLAYRRMIDAYYLREGPLPADIKEVARIVRLRKNLVEVEAVLREFFALGDHGWVQDRCDLEIAKMQEKQETLSEKDQHEKDRMQRFRERRSVMFTALRAKEIIPAWDIAMKELQRLFDDNCNAPETLQAHCRPVTGNENATAIPTPTPTPTPIRETPDKPAPPRTKREDKTLKAYLAECKDAGVKPLPPDHPIRDYCRDAGISEEMLAVAWCVFRDDYTTGTNKAKRYKDWPGHFANAVRGCWAKLWYTGEGGVAWTSRGQQEKGVLDARAKNKEGATA